MQPQRKHSIVKTIGEVYTETVHKLGFSAEADIEAQHIIAQVLGCSLGQLRLRFSLPCDSEEEIARIAERRQTGMPLAYALCSKNFYGYDFYVDGRVLIPRADTECVAQQAIALAVKNKYETLLDLCCGSGCLGITTAIESRSIHSAVFSDISKDALCVAQHNAAAVFAALYCEFIQGDLFENISGTFDIIVCNPPYISPEEYALLEPMVRDFEPPEALLAEREGYDFYEKIAQQCSEYMSPGGAIVLEIGCGQAQKVMDTLGGAGLKGIEKGRDLAGRDRFVFAYK